MLSLRDLRPTPNRPTLECIKGLNVGHVKMVVLIIPRKFLNREK